LTLNSRVGSGTEVVVEVPMPQSVGQRNGPAGLTH
jgi:hypothetical protein